MATKRRYFVNDQYYHVFNRGVEKRKIFLKDRDFQRFVKTIEHCLINLNKPSRLKSKPAQSEAPVYVVAYCLMPNHFHFLLKQNLDNGIPIFLSRLANSYAKYFNTKYDRVGPLFQGAFKSVQVDTDEQLLHLSRYIHLNPVVAGITDDPRAYQWSSYNDYSKEDTTFLKTEIILGNFVSKNDYQQFVLDQIDYGKELDNLKHLSLE